MNIEQRLAQLKSQFDVLAVIDLNEWTEDFELSRNWLENTCKQIHQDSYQDHQRIAFLHQQDFYSDDSSGVVLRHLQEILNFVDISNYFVILISTNNNIHNELEKIVNKDFSTITVIHAEGNFVKKELDEYSLKNTTYRYGSSDPVKIDLKSLTDRERFLLTKSNTFCIYPWIHLHAYPTGEAYPCCHAEMKYPVGNCRKNTLEEIWTDVPMQQLREDMLTETPNAACGRCYEQEANGFFSGRRSANKHHGHHVKKLDENPFEMTYWDIRFSNLCNLKCRSCGHIFSSQWYQDQAKLAGGDWKDRNTVLNYAGRTELDMWEQLEPHLDYVEQIYFAGGEPLLMEEHYRILEELVQRKLFHVRLIYNTNFTHTELRGKSVFEYWRQFDSVAVGASLDDSGARGEYIRKGTNWAVVEQNRRDMLEICPEVDFYISPTLSILNAQHLPEFHREWVAKGLIQPQDLNVNILQDPAYYRIDIAPAEYKQELSTRYLNHIMWLRDQDPLGRATQGFESAITFMNATDNTHLIDTFWRKTHELDEIRRENILDVIPELAALK
jgi:radical SAM protein with 4Fe4S-binding SPASM domain